MEDVLKVEEEYVGASNVAKRATLTLTALHKQQTLKTKKMSHIRLQTKSFQKELQRRMNDGRKGKKINTSDKQTGSDESKPIHVPSVTLLSLRQPT